MFEELHDIYGAFFEVESGVPHKHTEGQRREALERMRVFVQDRHPAVKSFDSISHFLTPILETQKYEKRLKFSRLQNIKKQINMSQ